MAAAAAELHLREVREAEVQQRRVGGAPAKTSKGRPPRPPLRPLPLLRPDRCGVAVVEADA